MKSIGGDKSGAKATFTASAKDAEPAEKVDFSKVKVEPLLKSL